MNSPPGVGYSLPGSRRRTLPAHIPLRPIFNADVQFSRLNFPRHRSGKKSKQKRAVNNLSNLLIDSTSSLCPGSPVTALRTKEHPRPPPLPAPPPPKEERSAKENLMEDLTKPRLFSLKSFERVVCKRVKSSINSLEEVVSGDTAPIAV